MNDEMIKEMDKYYSLKQKYEDTIASDKKRILNSQTTVNIKEKFKNIKIKCINCKRNGGTIFTNKNHILKAVCGNSDPCDLNIEINKGEYVNLREITDINSDIIDSLKKEIILVKLNVMFSFIDKTEALSQFNYLTNTLSKQSINQSPFIKKYNDIVDNKNKEIQLKILIDKLNLEINNIKNLNKLYNTDKKESILKTIIEKFNFIQPLLKDIQNLKYTNLQIEDMNNIHYLIAEPFSLSELEVSYIS